MSSSALGNKETKEGLVRLVPCSYPALGKWAASLWLSLCEKLKPSAGRSAALAEEKFRLAVETSPTALVITDESGQIAVVNKQTEKLFGYERQELIGERVQMLLPKWGLGGNGANKTALFGGRQSTAGNRPDVLARHKNASGFPVEIGLNPIHTPEGLMVLTTIVDLSERRRAESEAQRHREELAHVSRVSTMGELASSLAHELNQPLTAILSNAQAAQRFLEQGAEGLKEVREILKDIVSENRRASEVIRRMRAMLKKGEAQLQPLDINEAVLEVLEMMRSDLAGRNVVVKTDLIAGTAPALGDRVQVQQVLLNLIVNACEAMTENAVTDRGLLLITRLDEDYARVSVKDLGTGIAAGVMERIFEPFFTTKEHGMGIGLSISRSIIVAHGGRLWAENNDGRGATFHFTVPAHANSR